MRRMLKSILTFDGDVFPERIAQTIPYRLTELEQRLYRRVTDYVREGFDRAERLGNDKRKNTVGFALTVLQRRLASSPEAILRSLQRRVAVSRNGGTPSSTAPSPRRFPDIDPDGFDNDDYSAEERERQEEELVDAATSARTVQELDAELAELADLVPRWRDRFGIQAKTASGQNSAVCSRTASYGSMTRTPAQAHRLH